MLLVVAAMLAGSEPVVASSDGLELHAHRGGPLEDGVAVAPENSISASERAAARWAPDYVELDVKYTRDGVPVNFHDPTLDRTTTCTGRVADHTLAELRACLLDRLGTGQIGDPTFPPIENPTETVPTLEEMLDFSERTGTKLNVEIKNLPTDSDFNPSPAAYVDPIIDAIHARGMLSREHVLIQTFWPPDLDRAAERIQALVPDSAARPPLHLLTLQPTSEPAIPFAAARGYDGLGPQWPTLIGGSAFVQGAELAGLRVVPWTINDGEEIAWAIRDGVDGVITDDMAAANRAAGRPGPHLTLRVRARSPQRGLPRMRARVRCQGSPCAAVVRTRMRVMQPGRRARVFRGLIPTLRAELEAGELWRVVVPIRPRIRRVARRALRAGGRVRAQLTVRAVDPFDELRRVERTRIAVRR